MTNVLLWHYLQESEIQDVPDEVLGHAELSASDFAPGEASDFPVNSQVTLNIHILYIT